MNYCFKHQFTGTAYQIGVLAAAAQIVCQDSAKSVFISIKKRHLTLRFLTQADVHCITAHYTNLATCSELRVGFADAKSNIITGE